MSVRPAPPRATVTRHAAPLERAVLTAAGAWRERAGLLVELVGPAGVVGRGEASPLPGFSPDTLEEAEAELRALAWPALDLRAPLAPQLRDALAAVRSPSARFAAETALLDLAGRQLGRSVAALLGREEPDRRVPLAALVDDAIEAATAVARGVRALKVKVGRDLERDLARLCTIRAAVGADVALRVDANRAFARDEAPAWLAALAALAPEYVEEPAPGFAGLSPSPVPLAADESLLDERRWPEIAAACRVVVLKPAALGGLFCALELAARAAEAGLDVVISHLFDGPVALAACAELALALPRPPRACGLAPHAGLAAWPPLEVPQVGSAWLAPARRAGLGIGP